MRTSNRPLLPAMGLAGLSVLVFSAIGIAALTGNLELKGPSATGEFRLSSDTAIGADAVAAGARGGACANCGVVQSIERSPAEDMAGGVGGPLVTRAAGGTAATSPAIFVVRLRMDDGSQRVVQELFEPALSVGQRVRVVNGLLLASS